MSRKYSFVKAKRGKIDIDFFSSAGALQWSALLLADKEEQDAKLRRYGSQGLRLIKDGIYSLIVNADRSKA
jgi:hypothetical protein